LIGSRLSDFYRDEGRHLKGGKLLKLRLKETRGERAGNLILGEGNARIIAASVYQRKAGLNRGAHVGRLTPDLEIHPARSGPAEKKLGG